MSDKNKTTIKKTKIIGASLFIAIAFLISTFTCFKLYLNTHIENHLKIEEIKALNEKSLLEYQELVEYGSVWKYDDFISKLVDKSNMVTGTTISIELDGNKIAKDDEYIFNALLEHQLIIELNYDYKLGKDEHKIIKNNKKYIIKVVDTTPPIINGLEDKTIIEGTNIDLKAGISANDNFNGEISILVTPEVIPSKEGIYTIEVSATDISGNTSTGKYTVTVIPKPTVTTTSKTTSASTTKKITTTTRKKTTTEVNNASTKSGRLYLAKQEAKRVVREIINPEMTDEEKAYEIYSYIHSNVAVQTNQSSEAYKSNYGNEAYAALVMKIAACSGFCKAVTLLCNEAGLQSQHVNANLWIHQWNRVLINGEWIVLDAQGGIFGGTKHPLE